MIERALIWCSGADGQVLEECPTERTKFVGIGGTVLLTALLACFSGGYAMHFTFQNLAVSIPFGLLWGLIIFNLDRYIVSSMRKTQTPKDEWLLASPRIAIAVVLALTISKPLELRLFQDSVDEHLREKATKTVADCDSTYQARLASLQREKNRLETELPETGKMAVNDPLLGSLNAEQGAIEDQIADLKSTVTRNNGVIARNTESLWIPDTTTRGGHYEYRLNAVARQHRAENLSLQAQVKDFEAKLPDVASRKQKRQKEVEQSAAQSWSSKGREIVDADSALVNWQSRRKAIREDCLAHAGTNKDLLARLNALSDLKDMRAGTTGASILLTLLFIILECAPVTVKLLSKRGPYDEVLERKEYQKEVEQKKIMSDLNDRINNQVKEVQDLNKLRGTVRLGAEKAKLDAELKANQALLDDIAMKQAELAKVAVEKWYNDEMARLRNDPSVQYAHAQGAFGGAHIEDKLWKAIGLRDEVFYMFKNGAVGRPQLLAYFENGTLHNGTWEYVAADKRHLRLNVLGNQEEYQIAEVAPRSLRLKTNAGHELQLVST